MWRKQTIVFLICIFSFVSAYANTAPYFTAAVEDTNLTEDVYWSAWLSAADDDGDPFTFAFSESAPEGMKINSISGLITWTPDNDDVGVHQITAVVSDGNLSGYLTFFLYVNNVNDPPEWVNTTDDTVTVAEDSDLEITVTANDNDLMHGDHIKYLVIHGPDSLNIDSTAGKITWTPNNGDVGFYTITVRAQDDSSAAVDWTFKLEVTNTDVEFDNSPPTEINEDEYFEFNLESTDENQGNTIYYFKNEDYQPKWIYIDQYTGALTGTPDNSHVRTDSVIIIVDDSHGGYDTLAYELTVANTKPIIIQSVFPHPMEDSSYSADIQADDEGIGTTSYRFLDSLEWISLNPNSGVITGTPDNSHVGSNSFTIEFNDGNEGGKDTAQFVLVVDNLAPEIDSLGLTYVAPEDIIYSHDFKSSDDGQGTVSYHGIGLPDWLSINLNTGVLWGTPNNEDFGDYAISVYVWDGHEGGTDSVSFTIEVTNKEPQLISEADTIATEDSFYSYNIDYDDEGEGTTYSWQIQPSWLSLNTSTGLLSGTPDNSDVGDTTVSVEVDDGNGGIVYHTFNINVANIATVFEAQADTTVKEDATLTIDIDTDDEDNPTVTYTLIDPPENMEIGLNDGVITFTPDNAQVGTHTIQVSVEDNYGGIANTSFDIIVENTLPTITTVAPVTAHEWTSWGYDIYSIDEGVGNTQYSFVGTPPSWLSIDPDSGIVSGYTDNSGVGVWNVSVKVEDGNGGIDTQSWTLTVVNKPPKFSEQTLDEAVEDSLYNYKILIWEMLFTGGTYSLEGEYPDWLSLGSSNGELSGIPINSDVGVDTITIKLDDKNDGGITTEDFKLTVANSKPVFTETGDITIIEDQNLSVDLETSDEGDEGPGTSGYEFIGSCPEWLFLHPVTGVLSGTPDDSDVEATQITVRYIDGNSGMDTLTVNLNVINDPPEITTINPPQTVTEGAAYSYQFQTDDDPWGVTFDTLYTLPDGLLLSSGGLLSGTPTNAAVGTNTIGIIAADSHGGRDTLKYNLVVSNANPEITGYSIGPDLYTISNDTIFITEDENYSLDFTGNCEGIGDAVTYTVNAEPVWFQILNILTGEFNGKPDNSNVGLDSIDVTFSDGNGGSDSEKLYLYVQNVAPSFINVPGSVTATEDQAFSVDLNSNDEGQGTITYSITDGDPGWITMDAETGEIVGTPDNDDVTDGVDVTFQVTDGNGGTATKTIVFVVENMNDAPTWSSAPTAGSTVTTAEDALYTVDIDANDVDVGDNITYSLDTSPTGMTIDGSTGVITWTPDNSQVSDHFIKVRATDESSAAITRYWTVRVTNVVSLIDDPIISDFSPSDDITTIIDTFYIWEDSYYTLNLDTDDEGLGETSVVKYSFGAFDNPDWIRLSDVVAGKIIIRPTNEDVGSDSFKVYFTDQPDSRDTLTMYLRVQNVAPTLASAGPFTIQEDQAFSENICTSDKEDGDVAFSFWGSSPGWMNIETISPDDDPSDTSDYNTYEIPFDFPTIQQGIDAAVDGDLILVHPGTYYENITINKRITVASLVHTTGDTVYISQTIIDGGQNNRVVSVSAANAVLRGLTIQNGEAGSGAGVYCSADAELNQLIVQNNYTGGGLYINNGILKNSKIINNSAQNSGAGIFISGDPVVENVYLANNTGNDIILISYSNSTITNSNILNNSCTDAVWINGSGNSELKNITISNNSGRCVSVTAGATSVFKNSIFDCEGSTTLLIVNSIAEFYYSDIVQGEESITASSGGSYILGDNCISTDPLFVDPDNGDYSLQEGSPCIDTGDPDTDGDGISWEADADDQDSDGSRLDMGAKSFDITDDESSDVESASAYAVLSGTPTNSDVVNNASFSIKVIDGNDGEDIKSYSYSVVNANDPPSFTAVPSGIVSINQDETYTTDVDASDPDPDDMLSYSLDDSSDGMTINTSSGVISWIPTNDQIGDHTVTVKVRDVGGLSVTSSWTLRVNNLNDTPTWVSVPSGTIDTDEDSLYTVTIEANDIDVGDNITYSFTENPAGMTIDANNGLVEWTPDNDDVGLHDITVKATDDSSANITVGWTLSVQNVNDNPTWTAVPTGTVTSAEDATYTVDVDANDVDAGDVITYSLTEKPTEMSIVPSTGVISWTPDNSNVGSHTITVKATDLSGGFISQNFTLQITNVASAIVTPVVGDFLPSAAVTATADTFYIKEDTTYTLDLSAPDENIGDNAIYSFDEFPNPDWISLTNSTTGIVTLTPTNGDVGLDFFQVFFKDQTGSHDTVKIYLRVQNVAPEILTEGPFTATEGIAFSQQLESSDDDDGTITWSFKSGKPGWLTINSSTGILTGTPGNDDVISDASFTIEVNDGNGGLTEKVFDYSVENVNNDPVWTSVPSGTVNTNEDSLYSVTIAASDDDAGDVLTYSLVSPPTGMSINFSSGVITWTPDNSQVGDNSITVKATDLSDSTITSSWILHVNNLNDAPTWVSVPSGIIDTDEDELYTTTIEANDIDIGDNITYSLTVFPAGMTIDAGTGVIEWTPDNSDVGSHAVTIKAIDDSSVFITSSWDVDVQNMNDLPSWTSVPSGTVDIDEDSLYTVTITATDDDVGDVLTYSLVSPPTGMEIIPGTGAITWTPDNGQVGNHSISVKATDLSNANITSNWFLSVTNSPSQINPVVIGDFQPAGAVSATVDTFFIWEDSTYTLDLNASDEGLGDAPVYRTTNLSNPDWVTSSNTQSGLITLNPINKDVGLDSFRVVFEDQPGSTDTIKIYIRINNSPPTMIAAGPFSATEDVAFEADLESTDDDVNCSFTFVGGYPAWLTINASSGVISGTPTNDDVGTEFFTVQVNDGHGGTDDHIYSITVTNTNDSPVISSSPVTSATEDLVYQYDVNATDPDSDPLTYQLVVSPPEMTINASTGVIQWTPDNSHVGSEVSVQISVSDTAGESILQNWTVSVINTAPSFLTADETFNTIEDNVFSVDLSADDEGFGPAVYNTLHLPGWLSLQNVSTGLLSGTPDNNYVNSSDSVYIEFSDGNGGKDTLNIPVNVANIPPAFTAQNDTTISEGDDIVIDLDCDDEYAGGVIYYALIDLPDWLSLNANNGKLTGVPDNNNVHMLDINIRASDTFGGVTSIFFQLIVQNMAPTFTGTPLNTIEEDSLYEYTLTLSDNSGTNTFHLLTNPGWLSIDRSSGKLSGTPLNNHVGGNSVSVSVDDGNGASDTLDFPITVTNTLPAFTTSPATAGQEDFLYSVDLDCSDEGQGSMIYTALKKPSWLTLNSSNGLLKGMPLNNHVTAGDSIEVVVNDGKGGFDTLSYVLAISNTAPNITMIFNDTTITEDDAFSYDIASDDEAQGNTKYKFTIAVPSWISLDSLTGVISGTPLNNDVKGQFGLNIQVDDGNSGTDSETFFITVNNNPPAFTSTITDSVVLENEFFTYDATTDDEGQGLVTYSLIGAPGWLSIDDSSGALSGTPDNDDVDTSAMTIRFSDGNEATIDQHIHVIVENANDTPFITTTTDKDTLTEDVLWTNTFTANDSDLVHGDHLTFFLSLQPEGMSIDSASGIVRWMPENFQVGDTSFYLIVEDDGALRDSLLFDVHVNNVNDAPWIIAQSDTIAYEDSLFQVAINGVDIDPGDTIRYKILLAPAGVTIDDSSGLLSWTPDNGQIGDFEIITRVSDLSVTAADTDTFNVDVLNVNDAPVLVKSFVSDTLYEDSVWTYIFRASDVDSLYDDSLKFELSDHPAVMQIDSSTGQVSWTPENADVGSDSFIVWVYDTELASDSIKFRLTIINTNDPPIIVGIPDTTALEDSLFEYIVQYEDVDVGDSARFDLINAPFAMLIDSIDGKLGWTPTNDDRDSTFEIIYKVRDGIGVAVTDTFDLYVQNVNDAPVIAELDSIDIFEDSVFKMQFSEWFDKVSDIDNADSTLSWEVISFTNLSIQTTVDSLILSGLPDWFGSDTGEVIVSDGELKDTTELIVNILPVNDLPVIDAGFPSIISFTEDDTTELDLNLYVSDVDNELLDLNWSVFPVESAKSKSGGELAKSEKKPLNNQLKSIRLNPFTAALINSEGDSIIISIDTTTNIARFYAKPDFFIDGYDFTFVVDDSIGQEGFGSDTITATIQVNPANDPPVFDTLPTLVAMEDSIVTVNLKEWYLFVDDVDHADTLLIWDVINGVHLNGVISDTLFIISPEANWFGTDTLQLIISDGQLNDTTDVILNYTSVNDPPVFDPLPDISFPEDDTFYVNLNDYADDVETLDDNLIFTVQRAVSGGTMSKSNPTKDAVFQTNKYVFKYKSEVGSTSAFRSIYMDTESGDSIVIDIDTETHIASIYGTANYYTDPQLFAFYVNDGEASDSVQVNIGIESVNDKPVLDSLPSITFTEDSLYTLYLSQWDSLVYDVEDSDDTLKWSFEMDGTISLSYDTTNRKFILYGGTNYSGAATLTIIVTDLGDLSDTSIVDVTIIPVNDPPVIDSSLFTIVFDQKDTVDFILDNYVSDFDHSDQSLVWQFIPGDHVYLDYNDTTRIVSFWS
ncbi:MAG: putative Ig domain-containing protein, partial [Candidatus Marinimicrobia bacterium]|nr:putative Ig domain-containing protein [Candidatus Neomarinimicrobiota bacterium]